MTLEHVGQRPALDWCRSFVDDALRQELEKVLARTDGESEARELRSGQAQQVTPGVVTVAAKASVGPADSGSAQSGGLILSARQSACTPN